MENPGNGGNAMRDSVDVNNMEEVTPQNEKNTTPQEMEAISEGTICQFFLLGCCRFGDKCRNPHTGLSGESIHPHMKKEKKGKLDQTSKPKGKKPPMKTANDVISRIQWDTQLPKEDFIIGYLDRFLGTIEKPFSAFSWEDLASIGVDVLAIPKHRIQYFKYRDLIVWDKTTRIDNVFGSTGSGLTILDIIDQYETLIEAERNTLAGEQKQGDVAIDNEDKDEELEENSNSLDREHAKKLRPTHFIAVRISSEDVRHSVKEVQNLLQKYNPDMSEYFIPLPELHLTLCLLNLTSAEDVEVAYSVLQELRSDSEHILPPRLELCFDGLNDFHSRVLYLKPVRVPELVSFVSTLNESFYSKGLKVIDPPQRNSFHLTIAKTPRNEASKNPKCLFLPEVYGAVQLTHFGTQHVDCLSFCEIGKPRRTDGFYSTLLQLPLH